MWAGWLCSRTSAGARPRALGRAFHWEDTTAPRRLETTLTQGVFSRPLWTSGPLQWLGNWLKALSTQIQNKPALSPGAGMIRAPGITTAPLSAPRPAITSPTPQRLCKAGPIDQEGNQGSRR